MNQDKDTQTGLDHFLDQCNKIPFSENWRDIYGPITEKTIRVCRWKIHNYYSSQEVSIYTKFLDKKLNTPLRFEKRSYSYHKKTGDIPKVIIVTIDELLKDVKFSILIRKHRSLLEIPIEKGLPLQTDVVTDDIIGNAYELPTSITLYASLFGPIWHQFLSYLFIHNYVMPIMHYDLISPDILSVLKNKSKFTNLLKSAYSEIKPTKLSTRQTATFKEYKNTAAQKELNIIFRKPSKDNIVTIKNTLQRSSKRRKVRNDQLVKEINKYLSSPLEKRIPPEKMLNDLKFKYKK